MNQATHYIAKEGQFESNEKEGNSNYPSFEVGA